eukprot:TRINITY_DN15163_c0_g1_i2.p1 TRINITY_DN15163_c0_g1~~TRINITY_DN15163_c0_g1_i2.p1  ORF type:complete len:127 (-),score=10.96 TRINITY_DN15163_c0_g1_i2:3-383(-)
MIARYKSNIENMMTRHVWPPPLIKDGIPVSSCKFGYPLESMSSFISYKDDPVGFPHLSVLFDDKAEGVPLNPTQMIANLYANLASQARFRNIDSPSAAIGIVSNGYRFLFIVSHCLLLGNNSRYFN